MGRLFLIAAVFLLAVFSASVAAWEVAGQQGLAINSSGQATQGTAPASDAALESSTSQADYLACSLFPASLNVQTNAYSEVAAACRDERRMCPGAGCNQVPCPPMAWVATIGSISPSGKGDMPTAIHASGGTSGSGTITATGGGGPGQAAFSCSMPVAVAMMASGTGGSGSVGQNSGGAIFRTSTMVLVSCAGKPSEVKVTYYDSSAPSAVVDIFYIGAGAFTEVFSKTITGTATLPFTPEKSGDYEIHVSLGSDQATQGFSVQACGLQDAASTREAVNVRLAPGRELVLSKTILYAGGFAKDFRVYRVTGEGPDEYYTTEIKLHYAYGGSEPRQDFAISDSAPAAVVSKVGQISFNDYPDYFAPDPEVRFEWNVSKISKGEQISFSYSLSRPLTEQMIDSFAQPRAASIADRAAASHGPQPPADLAASLISAEIFNIPLAYILAAFVGIALAVMVLGFIFSGRKR